MFFNYKNSFIIDSQWKEDSHFTSEYFLKIQKQQQKK